MNRFGGEGNEYRYAWKALGLMTLAGQRAGAKANRDVSSALDDVQLVSDGLGMVPGWGEPFDLFSGGVSLLRGDNVGAFLSLGAVVPGAGNVAGAAKISRAIAKRSGKATRLLDEADEVVHTTYKLIAKNGTVIRTGRTSRLPRLRELEHLRTYPNLTFEIDFQSTSRDVIRAREQYISDFYKPIMNKINPVNPRRFRVPRGRKGP